MSKKRLHLLVSLLIGLATIVVGYIYQSSEFGSLSNVSPVVLLACGALYFSFSFGLVYGTPKLIAYIKSDVTSIDAGFTEPLVSSRNTSTHDDTHIYSAHLRAKNVPGSGFYVRSWAEQRKIAIEDSTDITPQNLFASIMWGISRFAKQDKSRHEVNDLDGCGLFAAEHYGSDPALLEIGCYILFRLDVWLFENKPHHREHLSKVFIMEFLNLFSTALPNTNLGKIYNERSDKYAEFARSGASIKDYHLYLIDNLLMTHDDKARLGSDFIGLKHELLMWEQSMIPAITESVSNYCEYAD